MIQPEVRDIHLIRFPNEAVILNRFEPDFDVTWAARIKKFNTDLSIYFVKPKSHISQSFGFTQELILAISDFTKPEARLIQAVEEMFQQLPAKGRVDQTVAIFVSAANNAENWVRDYVSQNPQTRAYVGIAKDEIIKATDSWFLRNKLAAQLFSRDLFDYTLPLNEDLFFFGRQAIVAEHIDAIRRSENRGIFGLRKTGKTSVLFKIRRQCAENNIQAHYYDCKLSSIYRLTGDALLDRICEEVSSELAKSGQKVKGWQNKPVASDRFLSLIANMNKEMRLCLIFDEIEYISVSSKLAPQWSAEFIPFWQTIWSVQSQHRKFSFIVAGVNASVTERDKIDSVQNPMFGIIKTKYLTGFDRSELFTLLNVFGKRMGMHFDDTAVDALFSRYGGHPLLTRMICSQINNSLKSAGVIRPSVVTSKTVSHDLASREEDVQFYCGHITSELEEFYPDEFDMLEMLATDNKVGFNELASEIDYVRHLKAYGLVDFSKLHMPAFKIPIIKEYIASKWKRRTGTKSTKYVVPEHRRREFIMGRSASILREMRAAEKRFLDLALPPLYNGSGPFEAEKFADATVCTSREDLVVFLNQANRSLVEPLDQTGRKIGEKNYFFSDLCKSYPKLWPSLNRVRAYRNNFLHLELNLLAKQQLAIYLDLDLDGQTPDDVEDGWFQIQSAVLNELLIGIQAEMAVYD